MTIYITPFIGFKACYIYRQNIPVTLIVSTCALNRIPIYALTVIHTLCQMDVLCIHQSQ